MRQACSDYTGRHIRGAIPIAILMACASIFAAGPVAADAGTTPAHELLQLSQNLGADELSSQRRRPRSRTVIEVRRNFLFDEPGAIYGYPPGNYILGPYGILYGPYPIRRSRPVDVVDY